MNECIAHIEIELLAETLLGGEGEQQDTVDIDIQVDEHGLPYFSGRTLKGVLRKEAHWFVEHLPEEKKKHYENALHKLFGVPDRKNIHNANYEALRFSDAPLHRSIYEEIKEKQISPREAMNTITTVRSMTSIDAETGTAKYGTLRKARVIHRGYTFIAPVYAHSSLSDVEKDLLTKAVKLLRHIGIMRNRGKGKVSCTIFWKEKEQTAVKVNDRSNLNDKEKQLRTAITSSDTIERPTYITLTIDLEQPLKINEVTRTRDSTHAERYIPGYVLRGALIHTYLRDTKQKSEQLDTETIFDPNNVQFWNGYLDVNGKRSLPFPQHLFETKASAKLNKTTKTIYNSLADGGLDDIKQEAPVRVNRDAIAFTNDALYGANVALTSNMHISVRENNRRRSDSLLYRYEAIAPQQRFHAIVQERKKNDFTSWLKEKDSFYVWLGGARNSGYGRAKVTVGTTERNSEIPYESTSFHDELYIMATSNWIIYNELGQLTSYLDEKWLSEQLDAKVTRVSQVIHTDLTGGYISHWSAYQPMIRAVKAGSIYRYKVDGSIDVNKLNALIERGVGSRTNEGFGRLIALPIWNYNELHVATDEEEFTLERLELHDKKRAQLERTQFTQAYTDRSVLNDCITEVNDWFHATGVRTLKQITPSQWSKLLQLTTDLLQEEENIRTTYKKKWEAFWQDADRRTRNKSALRYDKILLQNKNGTRMRLKEFILSYLYDKKWVNDQELSIQWSLTTLERFIRKTLRAQNEVKI